MSVRKRRLIIHSATFAVQKGGFASFPYDKKDDESADANPTASYISTRSYVGDDNRSSSGSSFCVHFAALNSGIEGFPLDLCPQTFPLTPTSAHKKINIRTMNAKISLSPHHPSLSQTMANPKAPPSVACTSHIEPLFHQGVFLMQRHALHNTRHIGRHPKSNVQYCCFTGCPTKPIGYLIGHSSLTVGY